MDRALRSIALLQNSWPLAASETSNLSSFLCLQYDSIRLHQASSCLRLVSALGWILQLRIRGKTWLQHKTWSSEWIMNLYIHVKKGGNSYCHGHEKSPMARCSGHFRKILRKDQVIIAIYCNLWVISAALSTAGHWSEKDIRKWYESWIVDIVSSIWIKKIRL